MIFHHNFDSFDDSVYVVCMAMSIDLIVYCLHILRHYESPNLFLQPGGSSSMCMAECGRRLGLCAARACPAHGFVKQFDVL